MSIRMWAAIMNNTIIAADVKIRVCSDDAVVASGWDEKPGSVAPYHLTVIYVIPCSLCSGNGTITEYDDTWDCVNCNKLGVIQVG
jgi:hypothetical protein